MITRGLHWLSALLIPGQPRSWTMLALATAVASCWLSTVHTPSLADIAPLGEAAHGLTLPDSSDKELSRIVMEAEDVRIHLGPDSIRVEADFVMYNPGKTAKGTVGFPDAVESTFQAIARRNRLVTERWSPVLRNFTVEVNGKQTSTRETRSPERSEYPSQYCWRTFKARFASMERTPVRVTYWVAPAYDYEGMARGRLHFIYVLKTGAAWAGSIGHAVVTIRLEPGIDRSLVVDTYPEGGVWIDERTWKWDARDLEPTKNVGIRWNVLSVEECLTEARALISGELDPGTVGYYGLAYPHLKLLDCSWQAGDTLTARDQALWLLALEDPESRRSCGVCNRQWGARGVTPPIAWYVRFCMSERTEADRNLARAEIANGFLPLETGD